MLSRTISAQPVPVQVLHRAKNSKGFAPSTLHVRFCYEVPHVRSELNNVKRIVVKLGTAVLTDARKQPDPVQMGQLVAQIARLRKARKEVVIVTSGAVGAGMGVLGFDQRPDSVAEQQAC